MEGNFSLSNEEARINADGDINMDILWLSRVLILKPC